MENKLCPFCDGDNATLTGQPITGQFVVVCGDCGAMGPWKDSDQEALEAWGNRPTPTPEALSLNRSEAMLARNWFLAMDEQLGGHHHEDAELYYKLADFVAD